ncbi:MAG: thioredoxin family protein [Coriobacteriia bacterium]|nr:thioredoxin family protein [Coriobacteriia bacterium]
MTRDGEGAAARGGTGKGTRGRAFVLLAVVAVFAALLAGKAVGTSGEGAGSTAGPGSGAEPGAVEAYESALKAGMPIYVLFHSETCVPCVEIDRVARVVVPEYEGRVTFVDAITDEPGARELAARFPFQYIPTSFFIDADRRVVDSYTGVLSADEMRSRLDDLVKP